MLEIEKSAAYPSDAIAVVGMALRVPGASDPDALWCMLKNGECSVSKTPTSRFQVPDPVDCFDNELFRISPREAKSMDPQQRLLLHVAFEALQDAGYVPGATPSFEAASFGVFVGAATHDYVHNLQNDVDSYYSTGTLSAFLSGRISYAFSFGGPSVVTNTACSSSCVALHQAVRSLLNEDCRTALAGGVNVITSPEMHTGLDAARFLTQNHDSSPFDANPSGYSRAEGCVLFVLKRAKDALNENDRILGIIRGAELNQSGQASSITRTHAPAQADLLRKLLRKAGVQPKEIRVVECHAAGTRVGDTSEVLAIREVFQRDLVGHEDEADPLYLTSVKANFGHLEAASGALSVAKAILMFRHFCIPPQVRITQMNSAITHPPSRFIRVPQAPVKWPGDKGPRYVIVNNYGAAGSNAGILLQAPLLIRQSIPNSQDSQATNSNHHPQCVVPRSHLNKNASFIKTESNSGSLPSITSIFSLSASTPERLAAWRDKVVEWFQREPDAHREAQGCFDIAYTTTARRQIYDYRIAFPFVFAKGGNSARNATSDSPDDAASSTLLDKLRSAPIEKSSLQDSRVVFVFPGQGCQYPGMGAHLYHTSSSFREDLNRCGEIASTLGVDGLLPYVLGSETKGQQGLEETGFEEGSVIEQLALWIRWGVCPDILLGHSLGEYVVLVVAGVLTIEDAVKLVIARRASYASTRQEPDVTASGMLAIYGVSSSSLHRLFDGHHPRFASITVACFNGPENLTLSGPLYQLHQLHSLIKSERGITRACFVRVAVGYHSGLAQVLDDIKLRPPTVAIASTVIGRVIPAGDTFCMRTYLSEHTIKPVLLHLAALSAIDHLDRDLTSLEGHPHGASLQLNPCVWIEVGPHENLIHLLLGQELPVPDDTLWLGQEARLATLHKSLARLRISWRRVFDDTLGTGRAQCISFPFMPFQSSRFWVPYHSSLVTRAPQALRYSGRKATRSIEDFWKQFPAIDNDWTSSFHIPVQYLDNFIQGHVVRGLPLCPGSVYVDVALAGVFAAHRCLEGHEPPSVTLSTISFVNALLPGSDHTVLSLALDPLEAGYSFKSPSAVHAHGRICTPSRISSHRQLSAFFPHICRAIGSLEDAEHAMSTSFPIFPHVVRYSAEYRALQRVVVDSSRMQACAVMKLPEKTFKEGWSVIHPVHIDVILHFAGFLCNLATLGDEVYICTGGFVAQGTYELSCSIGDRSDSGVLFADVAVVSCDNPSTPKAVVAYAKGIQFKQLSSRLGPSSSLPFKASSSTTTNESTSSSSVTPGHALVPRHTSPPPPSPRHRDSVTNRPHRAPELRNLLSNTLHIAGYRFDEDLDLSSLGLDSFSSVELLHVLRVDHGLQLPSTFFHQFSTIGMAQGALEEAWNQANVARKSSSTALDLYPTDSRTPLVLIHDGSGLIASYESLSCLGRLVWAIEDPTITMNGRWASLGQMIACYSKWIQELGYESIILGGWSFGGIVAFEVASMLLSVRPAFVEAVLLVDSPCPSDHVYLSEEGIDYALDSTGVALPSGVAHGLHSWFTSRNDLEVLANSWRVFAGPFSTVEASVLQGNHFNVFIDAKIASTANAIVAAIESVTGSA
ncbi:polyketide synthase [Coprinopsis sp. MPI-PUGE-AT-0042]|nr:polyketide synthase [Coprinopsis sp. MPI-PUGE-AT-0042]